MDVPQVSPWDQTPQIAQAPVPNRDQMKARQSALSNALRANPALPQQAQPQDVAIQRAQPLPQAPTY